MKFINKTQEIIMKRMIVMENTCKRINQSQSFYLATSLKDLFGSIDTNLGFV